MIQQVLKEQFGISHEIYRFSQHILEQIKPHTKQVEQTVQYNQAKVLSAFRNHRISEAHFGSTSGYGYDDSGREAIDAVYAEVFGAEDALVRHNIVSGTHAISLALFAVLRPGDTVVSVTGKPYDTLEQVMGIRGSGDGSLKDFGVNYQQVDLVDGKVDEQGIKRTVTPSTKAVTIQKSKGYDFRPSLTNAQIERIIQIVKGISPDIICIVDNCYGEFVEQNEPPQVGADLVAGSLIKNPGGGIAPTGGYVVGKKRLVELAAYRLNSVGLGKHVGATLGFNKPMLQGLFLAPHVVGESLKTALFCGAALQALGFCVSPKVGDVRSDIIQAVRFGTEEGVIAFCQGIQAGAPVDSFVTPCPWDMPGYEHPVIMAAGAFTQGASIELSADGPITPPYIAYLQGGLTFESGYIGVLSALQRLLDSGLVSSDACSLL